MNIVFIASEASPLAKTGGLADVVGALPRALMNAGHHVTVILPFYRRELYKNNIVATALDQSVEMWADGVQRHCPLHEVRLNGLRYLLIEQDDLFNREGVYGPAGGAYEDNLLRFVLFDRVALEVGANLGEPIDVLHCHDWQTGLIPLLLKTQYQHHANIAGAKTVYTIHNLAYQGVFPVLWLHRLGLPSHHFHLGGLEFHGQINCMKAGIAYADAITTVSPTYAREILTPEYGCQLEGFLHHHVERLSGIVNGLDVEHWDPENDVVIKENYGASNMAGKAVCKIDLQQHCGFSVAEDIPVLSIISRLADQKGIDLLISNVGRWMARRYQLAVLGSGDLHSEHVLSSLAAEHGGNMYFYRGFDEALARRIYAGSDIFLMPSRFEPCGLGQLMAMRYGTVPVVRSTGGLCDTVVDYPSGKQQGTGFHFADAHPDAFDAAVESAVDAFRNPTAWSRIRTRAVKRDSTWESSAQAYVQCYESLID